MTEKFMKTKEVFTKEQDEYSLYKLQAIMEKHGAMVSKGDTLVLQVYYFGVTPNSCLGKDAYNDVYFTTAGLYTEVNLGEWIRMPYRDICLEKMLISPGEQKQYRVTVSDVNGKGFIYTAGKEECENFIGLIQELCGATTLEEDRYIPIWLEGTYEYGEILIDFLKAGQHNTLAALKKCSEIANFKNNGMFKQMCEYALSTQKVTLESLKLKIQQWKKTLSDSVVTVRLAILFKDLVEILQLATGKLDLMSFEEKYFFEWLAGEAEITEVEQFKKGIMFPYNILTNSYGIDAGFNALCGALEYRSAVVAHIPWVIMDSEKIGFWSGSLQKDIEEICYKEMTEELFVDIFDVFKKKKIRKRREKKEALLMKARQILICDFLASMHLFLIQNDFLEENIFSKQEVREFIKGCIHDAELADRIYYFIYSHSADKEWNEVCKKYIEYDRSYAGEEMIQFLQSKEICMC